MTRATGWGWLLMWVTLAVGCGESSPVDMWIARDPDAGAGFEAPVRETGSSDVPDGADAPDNTAGAAGSGGGSAGSGGAGGGAGSDGAGSGGSGGSGGAAGDGASP